MAVLVTSCLALSLAQLGNQHDYQQTVTGTGTIALGSGRYVKVNTWHSGTACATLKVQYTDGTNSFESDDLAAASITTNTPYYFKSHGETVRQFSMAYTVATGSCALGFNARVKIPEDMSCVVEADLLQQAQGGDMITGRSDNLPRHHQRNYVKQTATVPSNVTSTLTAVEHADVSMRYFGLGIGPMVEIGCMQVYTTPTQYYTAAENAVCRQEMMNTDAMHASSNHNIMVKECYDCNAFTDATLGNTLALGLFGDTNESRVAYGSCCSKTSVTECNGVWTLEAGANVRACFWVPDESTCYPEYSAHYVDVRGLVGLTDTVTLASAEVHRPKSTYVTDPDLLSDGYQGVIARRWWLVVQNKVAVTFPAECSTSATVSYIATTTGGQCEPSSRRLCENTMASCMASPQNDTTTGIYWEATKTGTAAISDDKFHTCNCLKEKEVCYRKGGCLSTKKYQLILQNCLDQGCGNYCNSAAGVVASLAMTVLAVLAVLL